MDDNQKKQTGAQGQQSGGQPPSSGGKGSSASGQDLSGIMEENVDIGSLVSSAGNKQAQQQFMSSVKIPAHPNTKFDEAKFLELLAGSISLTINEKKKIIEAVPQLSPFQIDELIKIFEEEKVKFTELEKKHAEQIAELEKKHAGSWQDLEAKSKEEAAKAEEAKKAEELKKSLGL
jgi:hypothetical protein